MWYTEFCDVLEGLFKKKRFSIHVLGFTKQNKKLETNIVYLFLNYDLLMNANKHELFDVTYTGFPKDL